jgi:uncharacterized protein
MATKFFLQMGAIKNGLELYREKLGAGIPFMEQMSQHQNNDQFWRSRRILEHLRNIKPAVLTVGGWFDAEDRIELHLFNIYLKYCTDICTVDLPEALMFETGSNQWRSYDSWPPKNVEQRSLYIEANGRLSFSAPAGRDGADEYVSDPFKPVPFIENVDIGMTRRKVPKVLLITSRHYRHIRHIRHLRHGLAASNGLEWGGQPLHAGVLAPC